MKNQIKIYFVFIALLLFVGCKEKIEEKPFIFNGQSFSSIVNNSINGDKNSQNILSGLFNFNAKPQSYNKVEIDSIVINNSTYYTLLLENQNPFYNLFAVVDKELNVILKDESLNGYLELNFKKSGSRIFAVVSESFLSKDIIELSRVSYYILEEYSSNLAFRQFIKLKTANKEAEQVVSVISDTAIVTNIFFPASKTSKTSKDVFNFDVANDRYVSSNNYFDSLVYKEVKSLDGNPKGLQITDEESILRFFPENNSDSNKLSLSENDYIIKLDSTWKLAGKVTTTNFVKDKLTGIKYINSSIGASIFLAAVDSPEAYLNETLKNEAAYSSPVRYSDKFVDKTNIYQIFEFSCPAKKILMIIESSKLNYDKNKKQYDEIIQTFIIKC